MELDISVYVIVPHFFMSWSAVLMKANIDFAQKETIVSGCRASSQHQQLMQKCCFGGAACLKQGFRLGLGLEALFFRICTKSRPLLKRMDSSRHNAKQISLIQSSKEWGSCCSAGGR